VKEVLDIVFAAESEGLNALSAMGEGMHGLAQASNDDFEQIFDRCRFCRRGRCPFVDLGCVVFDGCALWENSARSKVPQSVLFEYGFDPTPSFLPLRILRGCEFWSEVHELLKYAAKY